MNPGGQNMPNALQQQMAAMQAANSPNQQPNPILNQLLNLNANAVPGFLTPNGNPLPLAGGMPNTVGGAGIGGVGGGVGQLPRLLGIPNTAGGGIVGFGAQPPLFPRFQNPNGGQLPFLPARLPISAGGRGTRNNPRVQNFLNRIGGQPFPAGIRGMPGGGGGRQGNPRGLQIFPGGNRQSRNGGRNGMVFPGQGQGHGHSPLAGGGRRSGGSSRQRNQNGRNLGPNQGYPQQQKQEWYIICQNRKCLAERKMWLSSRDEPTKCNKCKKGWQSSMVPVS